MAYTNSSLVTYTKISPNKTVNRTHAIDTVTIHCIVGQWTAKKGCDYFASTTRKCSANYVVGTDGSIGLSVEEKDRSWCSSNSSNDNRAVTIEVASDTKHPYAVNEKAYGALIELLVDICKRNNIKELKWKADKSLIGQVDKQNMTVHRWFAAKACPGEYLYEKHGQIAKEVNLKLGVTASATAPVLIGTPSTGSVEDEKKIWNFLMGKIGNEYAVAGIMGNLYAESSLRSNNLQQTYEKKLNYSDKTYTAAVDNGKYKNFAKDSAGYGLAQWTYHTRKQALLNYAKSQNKSIGDFEMQLNFLYKELSGSYKSVLAELKKSKSVLEASNIVLTKFERPANQDKTVQSKRAGYSQKYFDKYATKHALNTKTEFNVGDIVYFDGGKQYSSANATTGYAAKACMAKITSISKNAKHPYHCRAVNEKGNFISGVYGWVDTSDVSKIISQKAPTIVPSTFSPYAVRVTASSLNIRKGAGTNYAICGNIKDKGVYTIVEEANGKGAKKWGLLKAYSKNRNGWISLDYTKKI